MSYQLDRTLQLIEDKEALKAEVARLRKACEKEFADVEFLSNRCQVLSDILSQVLYAITPVSNTAYNLGQGHEQWDSICQSVGDLDSLRTKAYEVLKGKKS